MTPRRRRTTRGAQRKRTTKPFSSPACSLHELDTQEAAANAPDVRIKRIYEPRARADGFRVLVDRLWPRGMTKERAGLDAWARELAPSTELRKWFGHDPRRLAEFAERYRAELAAHDVEVEALRQRAASGRVTLLYAARDERCNHAMVLAEVIREGAAMRAPPGVLTPPAARSRSGGTG
jgi:uncharacterized protein YeaO (DUF488 family)